MRKGSSIRGFQRSIGGDASAGLLRSGSGLKSPPPHEDEYRAFRRKVRHIYEEEKVSETFPLGTRVRNKNTKARLGAVDRVVGSTAYIRGEAFHVSILEWDTAGR